MLNAAQTRDRLAHHGGAHLVVGVPVTVPRRHDMTAAGDPLGH